MSDESIASDAGVEAGSSKKGRRKCCEKSLTRNGKTMFTFRGSSFGGCAHSHIAALRGMREGEVPGVLQAIFNRGNAAEEFAKVELKKKGVRFIEDATGWNNGQSELVLWGDVDADTIIRLCISPDGLAWAKNARAAKRAVEVKSFSPKTYEAWQKHGFDGNQQYAYQASAVVHGYRRRDKCDVGIAVVPVIRLPEGGYELGDLMLLDDPPFSEEEVVRRCVDVVEMYRNGDWPKCDAKYPCRYPHKPSLISDVEMEVIVADYLDALQRCDALAAELELATIGFDCVAGRRLCRETVNRLNFGAVS